MLAYVLALVIGLGSIAMYMAAFFFPEVHRKEDFIWSGVGLFYALVLWVCAGRITGGVLLGQLASVTLLGWFGWQTLTLRRALVPQEQQTPIPSQNEVQSKLKDLAPSGNLLGLQDRVTGLFGKGKSEVQMAQKSVEATVSSPAGTSIDSITKPTAPVSEPAKDGNAATGETGTAEVTKATDTTTAPETTEDATVSSPIVTIIDATSNPTDAITEEAIAAGTPSSTNVATDEAATGEASSAEVTEATETPTAPEATQEEPATDNAQMSESPELIRPNPPAPELVEAAQESAAAHAAELNADAATPIEEIAPEVALAPPAEPPGDGDPQMRQNPPEVDIVIEGVPIDPENPPKLS